MVIIRQGKRKGRRTARFTATGGLPASGAPLTADFEIHAPQLTGRLTQATESGKTAAPHEAAPASPARLTFVSRADAPNSIPRPRSLTRTCRRREQQLGQDQHDPRNIRDQQQRRDQDCDVRQHRKRYRAQAHSPDLADDNEQQFDRRYDEANAERCDRQQSEVQRIDAVFRHRHGPLSRPARDRPSAERGSPRPQTTPMLPVRLGEADYRGLLCTAITRRRGSFSDAVCPDYGGGDLPPSWCAPFAEPMGQIRPRVDPGRIDPDELSRKHNCAIAPP